MQIIASPGSVKEERIAVLSETRQEALSTSEAQRGWCVCSTNAMVVATMVLLAIVASALFRVAMRAVHLCTGFLHQHAGDA